ncbi:hypothetical protein Tco_1519950 [Tanacetum coccineum]
MCLRLNFDYQIFIVLSVIAEGRCPDPGSLKGNGDYELEVQLVVDLPLIGDICIPVTSKGEVKLPSLADLWKGNKD